MKKIGVLIFITSSAFAADYPKLMDSTQKKFLDLYLKDKEILNEKDFSLPLKEKHVWSCPISKQEQYRLVSLLQDKPLEQEITETDTKSYEVSSVKKNEIKKQNVEIIPLKTQCINGSIFGDIELRTEYDTSFDQYLIDLSKERKLNSNINKITLSHGTIKNGSLSGIAKSFTKYISLLEIKDSNGEDKKKFNNPIETLELSYKDSLGNEALFVQEKKLNGIDYILKSSFTKVVNKNYKRKTTYKNNQIYSVEMLKDGFFHGEQLGYILGYNEKLELIQEFMPNTYPKMVKINNVDFIETRICMKKNIEIDMFPCVIKD